MSHPLRYLVVDISPVINQQLQAEGAVGGNSSHMQRCEPLVVRLVDIGSGVHQLNSHSILAQVAGDVQGCVSKGVGLVDLSVQGEGMGYQSKQGWKQPISLRVLESPPVSPFGLLLQKNTAIT